MSQPSLDDSSGDSPYGAQDRSGRPIDALRGLVDLVNDAVFLSDVAQDLILHWNRGAERLYGWSAAEARGASAHRLLQTEFPRPFETIRAELLELGRWSGELHQVTREGRRIMVSSRWTSRRGEGGHGATLLEVNTDITGRRQVESALRRTEARYQQLVESAPDAIVTVDGVGRIQMVNALTERLFGYDRSELLYQNLEMLLPEYLRAKHIRQRVAYTRNPHGRPMGIGMEFQARRKDGTTFLAEISLSHFRSGGEQLITAMVRDITERKAAEAERLRAEAAEQALRDRDVFLNIAAHELKTPLTTVLGFSQLLLLTHARGESLGSRKSVTAITAIARQSNRLNRLVNQLHDVTRIDGGNLPLLRTPDDFVSIARMVAADARMRTAHQIVVKAPPTLPALVDAVRVEQVLTNLVDNAIKFSPPDGRITIEVGPAEEGAARLVVRDEGPGIPEEKRQQVFDRYYQARSDDSRSGMGLGLYIASQFVEAHGGTLSAAFPSEGGTEMIAILPTGV